MKQDKTRVDFIRQVERILYDAQDLRISVQHRRRFPWGMQGPVLRRLCSLAENLTHSLHTKEAEATKILESALVGVPIWDRYLVNIRGVGPRMGALLIAETRIENCNTVFQLWSWWGLGVRDGKAQSSGYDPRLKAKAVQVLADSLIKQQTQPWYGHYLRYKVEKEQQMLDTCMQCSGAGRYQKDVCPNCGGTGGPAPWGAGKLHRHRAAKRYMMKQFLLELWKKWRELERLPIPEPRQPRKAKRLGR